MPATTTVTKRTGGDNTVPPRTNKQGTASRNINLEGHRFTQQGLGAGGVIKRYQKTRIGNLERITKPALRRIANRSGIHRVGKDLYTPLRESLKEFLLDLIHDAVCCTKYRRRRTVTVEDLEYAWRRKGGKAYGF